MVETTGWDATIISIFNFQCKTAREDPLKGLRSRKDQDYPSWQEKSCQNDTDSDSYLFRKDI